MSTVRQYLPGRPRVLRLPLRSAEHLLWIPQGGSKRIQATYSGGQSHTVFGGKFDSLSAVVPLVYIRVEVDVGDELVEY